MNQTARAEARNQIALELIARNARNLDHYAQRRAAHIARPADQDFAQHNQHAKARRVK